ncbi:hypothetical protein IV203_029526 [Nitzschia inconspicua]|uniref:Uncharacterized protein n=1 Tax=Nitzschia inconspicua TaxID=303405 RepID=A0A9K3LUF4_9STRA|nr:hypothetical protein IV203_029526 [Nitzschia inconspicua]
MEEFIEMASTNARGFVDMIFTICEGIAWHLGWTRRCHRRQQRVIDYMQETMGVELLLTAREGHALTILASKYDGTSLEFPESFEVFQNLELLSLSDCTGNFPKSLISLENLRILDILDCRGLNLASLQSTTLEQLHLEGDHFSNESFADFMFETLPKSLPKLQSLTVRHARRLTSFQNLLDRQKYNENQLESLKLADVCRKVKFRFGGSVSMLQQPEEESRMIEFVRAFKWPSIELCFYRKSEMVDICVQKAKQILQETMLNKSGIRILLGSTDIGDCQSVPLSLWPNVLVRERMRRCLPTSIRFTENDANFFLLQLCSDQLISGGPVNACQKMPQ